jgi:hypothetical protein
MASVGMSPSMWESSTPKYISKSIESSTVCVPSSEFGLFQPISPQGVCPPEPKGGGRAHSPEVEGVGSPNSDDWRKGLAFCLLFVNTYSFPFHDTVQYCAYHVFFIFTFTCYEKTKILRFFTNTYFVLRCRPTVRSFLR